jgi:hypothetical protein
LWEDGWEMRSQPLSKLSQKRSGKPTAEHNEAVSRPLSRESKAKRFFSHQTHDTSIVFKVPSIGQPEPALQRLEDHIVAIQPPTIGGRCNLSTKIDCDAIPMTCRLHSRGN